MIARDRTNELEAIKRRVKQCMTDEYQITHSTLEFEHPGDSENGHNMSAVAGH